MNEINERKLTILDGGIVFLISVTLLLSANLIMGFLVPVEAFSSNTYFYFVGIAEFVAVGLPPLIYILAKKVSLKSIFKKGISKEQAVICVFIPIFTYPILGFIRLLWMAILEALKIPSLSQALPPMQGFPIFLVAIVAISLLPGFSEEIIFRGIMQNNFQRRSKPAKAILISSLFFMLMHADVYSWTFAFAAGVILGIIYYITGSLWATIIFHAVNNFIGIAINYVYSLLGFGDLLQGNTEMFSQSSNMLITLIVFLGISIFCAGIVVLLFWALKKVSIKPEKSILEKQKLSAVSYVPYIIGGVIMVVMAVLPVIIAMIMG